MKRSGVKLYSISSSTGLNTLNFPL